MVLDGNLSQEYPVNAGVTQGSILGPSLFLLHNNDLSDDVICNSAIYAAYTTLSSNCDQASDLLQQLELPSHLRDTTDWARSGFLILVLEKLNCFLLAGLTTSVLLMWKWMVLFLRKNHLLRCWGRLSLLNWVGTLTLSLMLKLSTRKLEPWFILWSFCLHRLLCPGSFPKSVK